MKQWLCAAAICAVLAGCPMGELTFDVKNAVANGIIPEEQIAENAPFVQYMKNLKPMGLAIGASTADPVTNPFDDEIVFPCPQLFRGERTTLKCGSDSIATVDSSWTETPVSVMQAESAGDPFTIVPKAGWQHASFDTMDFLSNGASFVFNIPSGDGDWLGTSAITIDALGKYDQRLVVSGLRGSWFAGARFTEVFETWKASQAKDVISHEDMEFGPEYVILFERGGGADDIPFHIALCLLGVFGDAEFDKFQEFIYTYLETGDIQIARMRQPGSVLATKTLNGQPVAFGDQAVVSFLPADNTFLDYVAGGIGIAGRLAVDGDDRELVFVDSQRDIVKWTAGSPPQRLGYRQLNPQRFIEGLHQPLFYATATAIAVASTSYANINVYDENGVQQTTFPVPGSPPVLVSGRGLAIYEDEIYTFQNVADVLSVVVFNMAGVVQRSWNVANGWNLFVYDDEVYVNAAHQIRVFNLTGTLQRSWNYQDAGGAVARGFNILDDEIYLAATVSGVHYIRVYDLAGVLQRSWVIPFLPQSLWADGTRVAVIPHPSQTDQVVYMYDLDGVSLGTISVPVFSLLGLTDVQLIGGTLYLGAALDAPGSGFNDVILTVSAAEPVVSFDHHRREWWITDGNTSWVLTKNGLGGPFDIKPTSLIRDPQLRLLGIYEAVEDPQIEILTIPYNLRVQDYKRFTGVQVFGQGFTNLEGRADYKFDLEADMEEGAWVPAWINNTVPMFQDFIVGAIAIRADYDPARIAAVSQLRISYQREGVNVIRDRDSIVTED